jgi:hypothetical protein
MSRCSLKQMSLAKANVLALLKANGKQLEKLWQSVPACKLKSREFMSGVATCPMRPRGEEDFCRSTPTCSDCPRAPGWHGHHRTTSKNLRLNLRLNRHRMVIQKHRISIRLYRSMDSGSAQKTLARSGVIEIVTLPTVHLCQIKQVVTCCQYVSRGAMNMQ